MGRATRPILSLMLAVIEGKKSDLEETTTDPPRKTRFGNPDFFLIAYLAVWGVDLSIKWFGSGAIGWFLGTPIAAIGLVVSLVRWRHLHVRQRICSGVLLIATIFGAATVLPAL